MPRSAIVTEDAKKVELKELKDRIKGMKALIVQTERNLTKAKVEHDQLCEKYEEIEAMETKERKLSKNGKPLGRPRLSDEEKAARKAARDAARSQPAAGTVEVPADLKPLIPSA